MSGVVNATQVWNTTEYLGLINNVNTYMDGLLINTFLIVIFLVSFYLMKNFETSTSIVVSCVIVGMFCILIGGTGIGSGSYVVVGGALWAIALLYAIIN